MADPFGKDADRISVGERGIDSCERLGVLRHVGTLIELAVDRNRSGPGHQNTKRALEECGFREKTHIPAGSRPDYGGIEQRIRMIWQEECGARPSRPAPAGNAREKLARRSCD